VRPFRIENNCYSSQRSDDFFTTIESVEPERSNPISIHEKGKTSGPSESLQFEYQQPAKQAVAGLSRIMYTVPERNT